VGLGEQGFWVGRLAIPPIAKATPRAKTCP